MIKRNKSANSLHSANSLELFRAAPVVALPATRVAAFLAACALSLTCSAPAHAQASPDNTRYLASNCANCHGTNGASNVPGAFQLAGQKADYITEQMRAFKDGKKSATIMHQIAKGYSDEQVVALANYFSKQPKAK
jgi:cytochrome subunit of sulfide dehydrogenase